MKRYKAAIVAILVTFIISCTSNAVNVSDRKIDKSLIEDHIGTWNNNPRPSKNDDEFYTALYAKSMWSANSKSIDCMDRGFGSWLRKLFYKNKVEIFVSANISSNGDSVAKVPLFIMAMNEDPDDNQVKCTLVLKEEQLTPWFKAQSSKDFNLGIEVSIDRSSNVDGGSNLINTINAYTEFTGYTNYFVNKLNEKLFRKSIAALEKNIEEHISVNGKLIDTKTLSPINGSVQAFVISLPAVKVTQTNMDIVNIKPAVEIGMIYKNSIFTSNGNYPDVNVIRNTNLGGPISGLNKNTLENFIKLDGSSKIDDDAIRRISDLDGVERSCSDLKNGLSEGLNYKDRLAAVYAIMGRFAPPQILRNSGFSSACFTGDDMEALDGMGYTFPITPVPSIIGSFEYDLSVGDIEKIKARIITSPFNVTVISADAPAAKYQGDEAINLLINSASNNIGCSMNPINGLNTKVGMVSRNGSDYSAYIFNFDNNGNLEDAIIGSISRIKSIGKFGRRFGNESCKMRLNSD